VKVSFCESAEFLRVQNELNFAHPDMERPLSTVFKLFFVFYILVLGDFGAGGFDDESI